MATGSYRFNAGFFDGHVESLDDLSASNPSLWMPTGSTWAANSFDNPLPDVKARYADLIGGDIP